MTTKALTTAALDIMKLAKHGQFEIYDSSYPGLCIRVGKRRKTWSMFYRLGGKLHRITLGRYPAMSLAQAREAWRQARIAVDAGQEPVATPRPSAPRPTAATFREVFEDWMKRDQADNRSAKKVRLNIEREFLPLWQDRDFADISRREVRDSIDRIADRGAMQMARVSHARLRRLFTWAVSRDIITANPMTGLEQPGSATKRDRVLTDAELLRVWDVAGSESYPVGAAARLLILTGARREEISALKWSEIEGDTIKLSGERTKNGQAHDIPLSSSARALLATLPRFADCDFVFTRDGRRPVHCWSEVKKRLDTMSKVEGWRIHDLRRTVATGLQKLGVNLQVTESVLGHVSGSRAGVVGIYQRHDFANEKRAALEAWAAHVEQLCTGKRTGVVLPLVRA
jgi:integrase